MEELLKQVFQQTGLIGLLIVFLVTGPGFTYFRTRNIRARAEARAQEVVNQFARQERKRADRLEEQLTLTQTKLSSAEDEVSALHLRLATAQGDLDELPRLRSQVRRLTRRVSELGESVEGKKIEVAELYLQLNNRQQEIDRSKHQIQALERRLETMSPETSETNEL